MTPGVAINLPAASTLPAATMVAASRVPTGFPHTPEGAAAQLAAIEVRVLSAMSLPLTIDVYRDWALPGGVGAYGWSQTRNVQSVLTHARQSSNVLDPGTLVNVTPAAVQIKGTDGPEWVVACVLLDVRAALDRHVAFEVTWSLYQSEQAFIGAVAHPGLGHLLSLGRLLGLVGVDHDPAHHQHPERCPGRPRGAAAAGADDETAPR